jgi:hypothetical protein
VSFHTENYLREVLADMTLKVNDRKIEIEDVEEFERKMQNLPMSRKLIIAISALIASLIVCALVTIAGVISLSPVAAMGLGGAIAVSAGYSLVGLFGYRKDMENIRDALHDSSQCPCLS